MASKQYYIIIKGDGQTPAKDEKTAIAVYLRASAFYGAENVRIEYK